MDLTSILGYIFIAIVLLLGTFVVGLSPLSLLDFASFCIAVLGPIAATIIAHPLHISVTAYKVFRKIFKKHEFDFVNLVLQLITFSQKARRDGLLSLEDDLYNINDPYIKKGMQLIVDGTDPEVVRDIMRLDITQIEARHSRVRSWWENLGDLAPAFGLLGTLIGLIAMLQNIGGDASSIGKGMSAALITTLYGSFVANILAYPVSHKLYRITDGEVLSKNIVLEGMLGIQSGDNPRTLKEKLSGYLPPKLRENLYVGD